MVVCAAEAHAGRMSFSDTVQPPGGAAAPRAPRRGWSAGSIVATAAGSIIALVSLAVAIGGAVLALAFAFGRDDDGYFTTDREALSTSTPALTAEGIDLGGSGVDDDEVIDAIGGKVRIAAERTGGDPVFVGIARQRDLDAYLAGVAHDRVTEFGGGIDLAGVDLGGSGADYARSAGAPRADAPAEQDFWVASASGRGEQVAEWDVESGDWTVAVLNADGSPGVAVEASAGAKADWVLWAGIGLLVVGLVGFGAGLALAAAGVRRGERG
jgi:hypothetical protein